MRHVTPAAPTPEQSKTASDFSGSTLNDSREHGMALPLCRAAAFRQRPSHVLARFSSLAWLMAGHANGMLRALKVFRYWPTNPESAQTMGNKERQSNLPKSIYCTDNGEPDRKAAAQNYRSKGLGPMTAGLPVKQVYQSLTLYPFRHSLLRTCRFHTVVRCVRRS